MLRFMLSALVVWSVVVTVMVTAAVVLGARALLLRSRVHPSIETGAPLSWAWSPWWAPRLHRRLRSVCRLSSDVRSDRAPALDEGTSDLAHLLVRHAIDLDRALVDADRLPGPHRRTRLWQLRAEVAQLEHLAVRLRHHRDAFGAGAAGTTDRQAVLADAHTRLDLLEQARAEVLAAERLGSATEPRAVLTAITTPAR